MHVAPSTTRLVVLLVIDQLPAEAFERDLPRLRGGLARLVREGVRTVGEIPYANTFTAPGHATLATGVTPRVHGVIGNSWYRRDEDRELPAEQDPDAAVLPAEASVDLARAVDVTASGRALRVDGLAEALRTATAGRGRSVSIGLKARAACMLAGKRPDVAVWFEDDAGGMTTSLAYADALPPWLVEHNRAHPATRFIGQTWQPLDAAQLARDTRIADDAPGEGDVAGLGVAFPHPVRGLDALAYTPFADELVLDTVAAAIPALGLGADEVPDLLAISLNAHDYAGHVWGPGSWEVLDLTLRLDARLAQLFEQLDRAVGVDHWSLVLTSDHGATPLVERSPYPHARRIPHAEITTVVEAAMASSLGAGPWVNRISSSQLYLDARWHALEPGPRRASLLEAVRAARKIDGLAEVLMIGGRTGPCDLPGLARLVCEATAPDASGDLYLVAAPGVLISNYQTGTHHDAPFDDNRLVPIVVRAQGLVAGPARVSTLQVAPTVAALLGVPAPTAATEPPLFGLRARPR